MLIDTLDKSGGNLLAHLSLSELAELAARAADARIGLVLAGSLDAEAIAAARAATAGVRGGSRSRLPRSADASD